MLDRFNVVITIAFLFNFTPRFWEWEFFSDFFLIASFLIIAREPCSEKSELRNLLKSDN